MTVGEIITIAMFLITCGGLIWKMALMSSDVKQNKNDIKKAHERIDKYTEKHDTEMNEIKQEINNLGMVQARMEEKINFIYERLKDTN